MRVSIRLDGGDWVRRRLRKHETTSAYGGLVESLHWTDSLVNKSFGREKVVTPWTVWQQSHGDVETLQVVAAADGSGKWTLAPLPKADLQALARKHREAENAERKTRQQEEAKLNAQKRLKQKERLQEVKAQMAALNTTSGLSNVSPSGMRPSSRTPVLKGSPKASAGVRSRSPSSLTIPPRKTSMTFDNRRSSIEKEKAEFSLSRRSTVDSGK
jgi:hypothetical protein